MATMLSVAARDCRLNSPLATRDLPLSGGLQPFADDGDGHFGIVADHGLDQVSII